MLRTAAANGLSASILLKRVAARSAKEPVEVEYFQGKSKTEKGEHSIFLASMDRCNEEEFTYLVQLAQNCLNLQ